MHLRVELVTFDPNDPETYPSVCVDPAEVRSRFGFTGGEVLVFNAHGSYLGRLTDSVVPLMKALESR
jgi:hypothetical protein